MSMPGITGLKDDALVIAARAGRKEAFDELVNRYFGLVYAVAFARIGERDKAEDLVQEIFLRAYLLLDRLDNPALFSHWLTRMTRNLAIDWQRRGESGSRLIPMLPLDELPHEVIDDKMSDARERAASGEQSKALQEALARLRPEQREVVLLHYMEGLSHREIAQRTGVNQSTVSRHVASALDIMRGLMDRALTEMAGELRARPGSQARTMSSLAIAASLTPQMKATLTEVAVKALSTSGGFAAKTTGTSAGGGAVTLIQLLLSLAKTGGAAMGMTKAVVGIGVGAALIFGVVHYSGKQGPAAPARPASPGVALNNHDPLEIKVGLPPGKRIVVRTETVSENAMVTPKGMPTIPEGTNMKMRFSQDAAYTTREVRPDGGRTMDMEIVAMQAAFELGGYKVAWDSKNPKVVSTPAGTSTGATNSPMFGNNWSKLTPSLETMIGKKLTLRLGSTGDVESVEGADDLFKSISGNPLVGGSILGQSLIGPDIIKTNYRRYAVPQGYPQGPMNAGDSWKASEPIALPFGDAVAAEKTCKFVGWETMDNRRVARIDYSYDSTGAPKTPANSKSPMQFLSYSLKSTGSLYFDPELGQVTGANNETKHDMVMSMAPQPSKAMQIENHNTTKVTVRTVEVSSQLP